ncbi:MAG: carbohydrate ABC transporter permease [Bellilinea sp.]
MAPTFKVTSIDKKRKAYSLRALQENLTGYAFVTPAVIIILIFGLFPIVYSLYMSLFNWRIRKGDFTGLINYTKIFGDWGGFAIFMGGLGLLGLAYWLWTRAFKSNSNPMRALQIGAAVVLIVAGTIMSMGWGKMVAAGDEDFLNSLIITVFYAVGTVPLQLAIGMVFAYLLYQKIRGKEAFRMIYFLPYVTPVVTTAVVFRTIFSSRETSLANIILSWFNAGPLKWLFEPRAMSEVFLGLKLEGIAAGPSLALGTIILFGIWSFFGYNTVIFLAGLGGIPKELYEAAEIDGANGWNAFKNVTIPLLSPVSFYLFLVSFIGTFKAFNHLYVMATPNAQNTVVTASVQIFDVFYAQNNFGYAASQSIVLFLIILGLTVAQNKILGERVFYG